MSWKCKSLKYDNKVYILQEDVQKIIDDMDSELTHFEKVINMLKGVLSDQYPREYVEKIVKEVK